MKETETWTPIVAIVPKALADELAEVVRETMRSSDDDTRLYIETFCAEVGWPSDALALGAWLTMVINERLESA